MKRLLINKKIKRKLFTALLVATVGVSIVMSTNIRAYASDDNGMDYGVLVDALEDELREGNLSDPEDVKKAIDKVEDKYGVSISESDKNKIIKMVDVAEEMGIDGNKMADIVDEVYDKAIDGQIYNNTDEMINAVEEQIIDSAANAVKETITTSIKKSVSDYYRDFVDRIKNYFSELMSKWGM